MREKVAEAGGITAGGHSIADTEGVKYGLSVTGLVDPHHLYANDARAARDKPHLTKSTGRGAHLYRQSVGKLPPEHLAGAIQSMTTLNKTAAQISRKYAVPCRDRCDGIQLPRPSARDDGRETCLPGGCPAVPVLLGAWEAADAFLYTAAGQRNRNHTERFCPV